MLIGHFSFFRDVLNHILWIFSYCIVCLFLLFCCCSCLFRKINLYYIYYKYFLLVTCFFCILTVLRVSFVNSCVVQIGIFFSIMNSKFHILLWTAPILLGGKNLIFYLTFDSFIFYTLYFFHSYQFNLSGLNFWFWCDLES